MTREVLFYINASFIYFFEELSHNAIIPDRKVASLGQTVVFKCARHIPVLWFHNKKQLPPNTLTRENTLIILGVRETNTWWYHCYGKNDTNPPFLGRAILILKGNFML